VALVVGSVTMVTALAQPHLPGSSTTVALVGAAAGLVMGVSLHVGLVLPLAVVLQALCRGRLEMRRGAAAAGAAGGGPSRPGLFGEERRVMGHGAVVLLGP
jgi:hypothetical protein